MYIIFTHYRIFTVHYSCFHVLLLGHLKLKTEKLPDTKSVPERLRQAWESCEISEAPLRDTGRIPGDQLGAAGFDSFLCS